MKTKKVYLKKSFALMLVAILLITILTSCKVTLSFEDSFDILTKALANSLEGEYYHWWENINQEEDEGIEKKSGYRTARYIEDKSNPGLKTLYAKTEINGKLIEEYTVGLSQSVKKGNESKEYLFMNFPQRGDNDKMFKELNKAEQFILDPLYSEYTLQSIFSEISQLKKEDITFNTKNKKSTTLGKISALYFSVNENYIKKYEIETGKPSIFKYSERVFIEVAYDRISNIVCYRTHQLVEYLDFLSVEIEFYELFITYNGERVFVPNYDNADWDDKVAFIR